MYRFSGTENEIDQEGLRARLQKQMSDQELRRFELAARFMCPPGANLGSRRVRRLLFNFRKRGQSKSAGSQKRNTKDDKVLRVKRI